MAFRFWRRVPIIGRFVTLNLSKGGASVSVGVPGAHITTGMHGTQATVGLPGTGLFYTHKISASTPKAERVAAFVAELQACPRSPVDPVAFMHALNRQQHYGLADADLSPELHAFVVEMREALRADYGYRIVSAPSAEPSSTVKWVIFAILVLGTVIGLTAVYVVWNS